MKHYQISEAAKRDLACIYWRGCEEYGPEQADRYFQELIKRFDELVDAPYKYQAVDHIREGYRRSVCGSESIYYRVHGDLVEIMRVLGHQNPDTRI